MLARENIVSSSVNSIKSYTVQICSSPTCSCPDSQKNGLLVFCKHILFLLRCVLRINKSSELLKNRYFSDDDVIAWFYKNPINGIDQQYVQKVEKAAAISVTCRRYYQIILFTTNQKQLGLWTRLIKV